MVDESRYPTVYDTPALRKWMRENLVAQDILGRTGVEFQRHYAASTACAASRTSIFTGQYPSLHDQQWGHLGTRRHPDGSQQFRTHP
jgi:arylsulfatase A-like enzyme